MGTGYVLYFKRISICKGMWVAYLKGLIYIDATQGSYILLRCVQACNINVVVRLYGDIIHQDEK